MVLEQRRRVIIGHIAAWLPFPPIFCFLLFNYIMIGPWCMFVVVVVVDVGKPILEPSFIRIDRCKDVLVSIKNKKRKTWYLTKFLNWGPWLNCACSCDVFFCFRILCMYFYPMFRSFFYRDWLGQWWMDYIYLRQRTPIACMSSWLSDFLAHNHTIIFPPTIVQSTPIIMYWDQRLMRPSHNLTELPWSSTLECAVPSNFSKAKRITLLLEMWFLSVWAELGGLDGLKGVGGRPHHDMDPFSTFLGTWSTRLVSPERTPTELSAMTVTRSDTW